MDQPTVTVLINPIAGNAEGARIANSLRCSPEAQTIGAEVVELSLERFGEQVSAARTSELVVVCGGDGTVSKVLGELPPFDGAVGVFPLGTANDLAREFKVAPLTAEQAGPALLELLQAPTRPLDIWEMRGRATGISHRFINYCSWGYDAAVLADVDHFRHQDLPVMLRNRIVTRIAYAVFGLQRMFAPGKLSGEIHTGDGVVVPFRGRSSILLANVRSYMGLGHSNEFSEAGDGKLEILGFGSPQAFAEIALGWGDRTPLLSAAAGTIRFQEPPRFCQLDGERIEIGEEVEFSVSRHSSVPLRSPKNSAFRR